MEPGNKQSTTPGWSAPTGQAGEILRLHRAQVAVYTTEPSAAEGAEDESGRAAQRTQPVAPALSRDDLPPEMRQLLENYEASHSGVTLTPVRYVSIGAPGQSAMPAPGDLPPDAALVSLVLTQTIVDAEQIDVRSRVLLATRTPAVSK